MLGYWDDAAKTAETFRDGWLHTGDLGILDDEGYLYVVDRKKDMIKSGGENVASREVEEVIHAHPAVAEAAVFGIPHPRWIEAVAAVVVPRAGHELAAEEVTRFCRDRLAGFKTPRYVVIAAELPKNPSGKILKRELRTTHAGLAQGDEPMSTIVIIDHGVVGDREVERSVLEAAGHDVIDTQELGLSAEEGFDLAVERDAVAILAGPIIPLDRAHLERLESCRAVVRYGVGLDNVDIDVAQELGIAVGNVPEYGHEEISNHAIALLLGALAQAVRVRRRRAARRHRHPRPAVGRAAVAAHARARRLRPHRPPRGGEGARVRPGGRGVRPVRQHGRRCRAARARRAAPARRHPVAARPVDARDAPHDRRPRARPARSRARWSSTSAAAASSTRTRSSRRCTPGTSRERRSTSPRSSRCRSAARCSTPRT